MPSASEGHTPALIVNIVAVGDIRGFSHGVDAKGRRGAEWNIDIGARPVLVVRSKIGGNGIKRTQRWRLAHLVDRAAGRAATK